MRFASESDLRQAIGLSPLPDYQAAATAALDLATLTLENDLRTLFDRVTQTDVFRPNPNDPSTLLKLKQAFVAASPAPVVLYAASNDAYVAGESLDITSICKIDADKGLVAVAAAPDTLPSNVLWDFRGIRGSVISVTYTAGFEPSQADPDQYDTTGLPSWLVILALTLGQIQLASHPAIQAANAVPDVTGLKSMYAAGVSRRTRYAPNAILPAF